MLTTIRNVRLSLYAFTSHVMVSAEKDLPFQLEKVEINFV